MFLAFNGVIDYETAHFHTLQYQVFDSGVPQLSSSVRDLTISINDINDNKPIITTTNQQVSVREDTPVSTVVFIITATDADSGQNGELRFQIIPPNTHFSINALTGDIELSQPLDYETATQHLLTIRVYDLGSPKLNAYTNFTVNVLDRNDNSPVFSPPAYNPSIFENSISGFFVVLVTATDIDDGEHMNLNFTLIDDTSDPGLFTLTKNSSTTAVITVSNSVKVLDRESQDTYTLFVVATDNRNLLTGGVPDRDTVVNSISAEVS